MKNIIKSPHYLKSRAAFSTLAIVGLILGTGCGAASNEPASATQEPTTETAPSPSSEPAAAAPAAKKKPAISEEKFGEYDGQDIKVYTLRNDNGLVLKAMNYGAIITELLVPDAKGELSDIVLGFDTLDEYVKASPFFGATIGRVANRIKNAKFELEGKKYSLANNDAPNFLHGGKKGWDKVVWNVETKEASVGPQLIFTYTSAEGEEGFPGTVKATTIYTLTNHNELRVEMRATTDKTTLINMAHHSYWNLGGQTSGTILDHELSILGDSYTPAVGLVPNGQVKKVAGTPFDFTTPKLIGKDLKAAGGKPVGFDHNWIINGEPNQLRPIAQLKHPASGRVMNLSANQPGLQFYSGNFLDGTLKGKGGAQYPQYSGLCLESQKFPNSINVPAWKNDVILKEGEVYEHIMVHAFTTEPAAQ